MKSSMKALLAPVLASAFMFACGNEECSTDFNKAHGEISAIANGTYATQYHATLTAEQAAEKVAKFKKDFAGQTCVVKTTEGGKEKETKFVADELVKKAEEATKKSN